MFNDLKGPDILVCNFLNLLTALDETIEELSTSIGPCTLAETLVENLFHLWPNKPGFGLLLVFLEDS